MLEVEEATVAEIHVDRRVYWVGADEGRAGEEEEKDGFH